MAAILGYRSSLASLLGRFDDNPALRVGDGRLGLRVVAVTEKHYLEALLLQ